MYIIIGPNVPKLGFRVDFLPAHLQTCPIKKGHPKEKPICFDDFLQDAIAPVFSVGGTWHISVRNRHANRARLHRHRRSCSGGPILLGCQGPAYLPRRNETTNYQTYLKPVRRTIQQSLKHMRND